MSQGQINAQPQQQEYNPEPDYTRNLMVNYIPTTVDEVQLRSLFDCCGPIESVKIVCDRDTRQSRGYGFVKYQTAASAQQAISRFNGFSLINKRLKVALAASGNQRQRNNNNNVAQFNNPMGMNGYYQGNFGGYPQQPNPYNAQQAMMAMQAQQQYMQLQNAQQQQARH